MKKTFFFILGAAAMLLASCAKELEAPVDYPKSLVTFVANAGSKTIIAEEADENGNYAVTWKAGDVITIFDNEGGSASYTVKDDENEEESIVFGVEVGSAPYTAIAGPVENVDAAEGTFNVEMKDPDGSFGGADLLATRSSSNMLTFHHALSFVEFRVRNEAGVDKVSFSTPENFFSKNINLSWDGEDITASVIKETKDGADWTSPCTLEMDLPENLTDAIVYVPIIKGDYTGFDIRYTDASGITYQGPKMDKSFSASEGGVTFGVENVIEGEKSLVENFTSTVDDTQYSSSKQFNESNCATYNYSWKLSDGCTATVGHNFIKTGKSGASGTIETTDMLNNVSTETVFTVKVFAANWPGKESDLLVEYNTKTFKSTIDNNPDASADNYSPSDFKEYDFVFKKADDVNGFKVGGTTERVLIDKIEIVEGGVLPEPFSVSTESLTPACDDTEATFDITAGEKVDWSIAEVEGLTFSKNGTDYSAGLEGTGNATITVKFAQNENEEQIQKEILVSTEYSSVEGEKSYIIDFTQALKPSREMDGDGTAENPYSVADALYLIGKLDDGTTSQSIVYVKGTIVGESAGIETKYGNATFEIVDNGTSTPTLTVYRVKDLSATDEGASFTATDQLVVNDVVVVYAKLKKYVKGEDVTPETDQGKLYSINSKTSILTGITLGEKKTEYFQDDSFVKPTVTASYRGKNDAVVTDAAEFSGYNMAEVGIQAVTASYTEDGITKTNKYDITVSDNTDYTITTNFDGSKGSVSVKVNNEEATTAKATQSVEVTVTPNSGNIVTSFKVNNAEQMLTSGSYTFKMPTENVVIDVTFDAKPAGQTISQTSFSAVSGNLNDDANISYGATKGNGTTAPVINSEKIRLYKPSSGNATGGILTITANNGAKITSVTVVSNRKNAFNIAVDGAAHTEITETQTYTVSDINASTVTFTNIFSNSNDISSIEVTYYGGTKPEPAQLEMTTVTVDSKTSSSIKFKWDAVDHAKGYKVKVGDGSYGDIQTETTYTVSDLEPEQKVTVYVCAVGNGGLYLDSDPESCEGTTEKAGQGGDNYVLCTSTSDLVAGAHYIIASGMSGDVNCISNENNSNNRKTVKATVSDSKIAVSSSSKIMTFTLGESSENWTLQTDNYAGNNGYLASAASGKNNYCRVISDETTCTIEFSEKAAEIRLQPHSERNLLRFNLNNGSPIFACYSSGQNAIYLYKKSN